MSKFTKLSANLATLVAPRALSPITLFQLIQKQHNLLSCCWHIPSLLLPSILPRRTDKRASKNPQALETLECPV